MNTLAPTSSGHNPVAVRSGQVMVAVLRGSGVAVTVTADTVSATPALYAAVAGSNAPCVHASALPSLSASPSALMPTSASTSVCSPLTRILTAPLPSSNAPVESAARIKTSSISQPGSASSPPERVTPTATKSAATSSCTTT